MPAQPQAALQQPQNLPSVDRHGLNQDAFLGVGEEMLKGEMPLGPGGFSSPGGFNAGAMMGVPKGTELFTIQGLKSGVRKFTNRDEAISYARKLGDDFVGSGWIDKEGQVKSLFGYGGPRFGTGPLDPSTIPQQTTSVTDATTRFTQRDPSVLKKLFE
tara:strand:- start:43 stop:516 length:474 start_codon:yes stop_codon:yes gene_type:complete